MKYVEIKVRVGIDEDDNFDPTPEGAILLLSEALAQYDEGSEAEVRNSVERID